MSETEKSTGAREDAEESASADAPNADTASLTMSERARRLRDGLLANPAAIVVVGLVLYLLDLLVGGWLIWVVPGGIALGTIGYFLYDRVLAPYRE